MSTIDENWNIIDVTRAFCQKVLPLVYDESLSYLEMVCKMSSKLNEVIDNNNNLPQYVKDLIKETVNSDEFVQIVGSVLMNTIINVKFPPEGITPAKGDGVTDDTKSIQDCLDYANAQGGAVVFFPSGKYLTSTLSIAGKTSILGADRYNTTLFLKGGGNTPLLQGVIHQSVRNITFDGNRLNQIEENYLIDGDIENALLDNVILEDSAHCITSEKCNANEFSNVKVLDIGDSVFIDAIGSGNLLSNINTSYSIIITGDNNNWQSPQQTKIDSVEPLEYQEPQKLNDYFNYVTMQQNGDVYKVLISGENIDKLGIQSFATPEEYGAKGDGVTDDTIAIANLLSSDKIAIFNPNSIYKITPSNIPITKDINFNNCTLLIDNDGSNKNVFTIFETNTRIDFDQSNFTADGTNATNLFSKSFMIETPVCLGTSKLDNALHYYRQLLVTDSTGLFVNTKLHCNIVPGTYKCYNIQESDQKSITLQNCNIIYKNSGIKNAFLEAIKNNLIINNFNIKANIQDESISYIFKISFSYNITFKNIVGNAFSKTTPSYLLNLYCCSDVTIDKLISNDQRNWHEIGGGYLSNITIRDSIFKQYDSHYMNTGHITIENSTLFTASFGNGFFDALISNCCFIGERNIGFFRADTPVFFNGTIRYINCQNYCKIFNLNSFADTEFNSELLAVTNGLLYFENCNFRNEIFSIANYLYQNTLTIEAKNCKYNAVSANPSYFPIKLIILDNCIYEGEEAQYFGYALKVIAKNMSLQNGIGIRTTNQLELFNISFPSIQLSTTLPASLKIGYSDILSDINLTEIIKNVTNYSLFGNNIIAETKNNLANVNGVK